MKGSNKMCQECELREELKKAGIPDIVDIRELADFLDISPRRIYALARDGIISQSSRGKYNLLASIEGYVSYLKDQVIVQRVEHRY
jgi:hypothetical protein